MEEQAKQAEKEQIERLGENQASVESWRPSKGSICGIRGHPLC